MHFAENRKVMELDVSKKLTVSLLKSAGLNHLFKNCPNFVFVCMGVEGALILEAIYLKFSALRQTISYNVFTLCRNMSSLIMNETCNLTVKIVHIRRRIALIVITLNVFILSND